MQASSFFDGLNRAAVKPIKPFIECINISHVPSEQSGLSVHKINLFQDCLPLL
jgi:hypothetical protein